MRRPFPNLNWVRSFEAAARYLSFTEAARDLNMTQAGVSLHIRHLEHFLGERLFDRLPRSLQLTDAGEAYLLVVRESFDRLFAGTEEIFGIDNEGPVTCRVNIAFATNWLARRLGDFVRANPDVSVRIVAAVHGMEAHWDGTDLEIRYGAADSAALVAECLSRDHIFPVCSPALSRGNPPLAKPSDLARHRLLHVIGNQQGWKQWLREAGLEQHVLGEGVQCDTSAIALEMACHGIGIALGLSSLVEQHLRDGRLLAPFDIAVQTDGIFHVVQPRGRALRPQAARFRNWLIEETRYLRQSSY